MARCDECGGSATRVAVNTKTDQCRTLCKFDSKQLPNSDSTRKFIKVLWRVQKIA